VPNGKHAFIDEELNQFLEKFMEVGDFPTKRKASKKAGEILNAGLDEMADGMREEMEVTLDKKQKRNPEDDFGIDHELLGI